MLKEGTMSVHDVVCSSHCIHMSTTCRTPKDFASASTKIWPHFAGELNNIVEQINFNTSRVYVYPFPLTLAALGYSRTAKEDLIAKGIIGKVGIHTHQCFEVVSKYNNAIHF